MEEEEENEEEREDTTHWSSTQLKYRTEQKYLFIARRDGNRLGPTVGVCMDCVLCSFFRD